MRTKQELMDEAYNALGPNLDRESKVAFLQIEVLLDIRELLIELKDTKK